MFYVGPSIAGDAVARSVDRRGRSHLATDADAVADHALCCRCTTEGADHRDTRFAENWRAAGASGLARGAYHFFTFCTPGREQAANFLAAAPPGPGLLPPVVDVEFTGNCKAWTSVDDIRTELAVFLEDVEAAWGVPAILYLTRDARARIVDRHFDTRPKWLRNVYWRPSARGENPWLFWQFTDEGRIDGIDSPVDMNVYRGTSSEFAELLSL